MCPFAGLLAAAGGWVCSCPASCELPCEGVLSARPLHRCASCSTCNHAYACQLSGRCTDARAWASWLQGPHVRILRAALRGCVVRQAAPSLRILQHLHFVRAHISFQEKCCCSRWLGVLAPRNLQAAL